MTATLSIKPLLQVKLVTKAIVITIFHMQLALNNLRNTPCVLTSTRVPAKVLERESLDSKRTR